MKKTTKDFKYCKILGCFIFLALSIHVMLNARAHVRNTKTKLLHCFNEGPSDGRAELA